MNLEYFREAMNVKRFHTECLIREDTVGHHSANVAGIILYLYHPEIPSGNLLAAALFHDVAERRTGDIPATAKWLSTELRSALRTMEELVHRQVHISLPDHMLSNDELHMLKFADSAELGMKCMHERDMGNRTVSGIISLIRTSAQLYMDSHPLDSRFSKKAKQLLDTLV